MSFATVCIRGFFLLVVNLSKFQKEKWAIVSTQRKSEMREKFGTVGGPVHNVHMSSLLKELKVIFRSNSGTFINLRTHDDTSDNRSQNCDVSLQ